MNVIQNYLTSFMKGEFSVYEIRIFMKVVEQANHLIHSMRVSRLIGKAVCVDGVNCNFEIPAREIVGDNSHHTKEVKEALQKLHDKDIEFYDGERRTWHLAALVDNITLAEGDATLRFTVPRWIMQYILNFVNGNFTMYDLQSAMQLNSAYAVRMYWIVCNQSRPLTYNLELFRQMLGVPESKYKATKDFVKRCVEPSRLILNKKRLNSFTYVLKRGAHGKSYQSIMIYPVRVQEQRPEQLTAQAALSAWCNPILRQYLTNQAMFEIKELQSHKALLMEFGKLVGWQAKIVDIVARARRNRAGKGYIINAMKSDVEENKKKDI